MKLNPDRGRGLKYVQKIKDPLFLFDELFYLGGLKMSFSN